MKGWSYLAIPSVIYASNVIFWISMGLKVDIRDALMAFIMLNWYSFSMSTMSGKWDYTVVFIPWVFFPPMAVFSIQRLGSVLPGFFALFSVTLAVEMWKFGEIRVSVFLLRLLTASVIGWELRGWLREFTVLSSVIAGK